MTGEFEDILLPLMPEPVVKPVVKKEIKKREKEEEVVEENVHDVSASTKHLNPDGTPKSKTRRNQQVVEGPKKLVRTQQTKLVPPSLWNSDVTPRKDFE